jgi:hypothetical protein
MLVLLRLMDVQAVHPLRHLSASPCVSVTTANLFSGSIGRQKQAYLTPCCRSPQTRPGGPAEGAYLCGSQQLWLLLLKTAQLP